MKWPHVAGPGPFKGHYLVNLEARLYIGQFPSFVHAFAHWKRLGVCEKWFIVTTENALRIATSPGGGKWFKLDDPRPMKKPTPNHHVPGRFNSRNKTNAQGAKRPSPKRGAGGKFLSPRSRP